MSVTGGLKGLNFTARIGTTQLQSDGQQVKAIFRGIGDDVRKVSNSAQSDIDKIGVSVAKIGAAYLSLDFANRIGKEIISVRGEFQQLGIAFETMLGSKEKSDRLMAEQIALAQKTPFTLVDVATNTKQLLAMGIGAEKVMATMKSLGDVAAGVSVPLARVAINYGQVATLGKLQEREIRDFAMAGIPLIDELAKNLGKAKDEISAMVTAGQIGFPEVEKAFQTMAGEGGKFYNLMEKQNASVTGQISNLTDKLQVMMNELGKSNEGAIYGGISGLTAIIENYQDVIDALKVLVVSYGAYKTSLIAISAYESAVSKIEATRAAIIAEKVAVIRMGIAAEEKKAAALAANAAQEQIQAAIEAKKQAAALKTIEAMEASQIATAELTAAEERLAAVKGKHLVVTSELTAVENARTKLNKAIAAENKAITAETAINAKIESAAVSAAAQKELIAKEALAKADRDRLIASQTATAAEVRAAATGGIWKTLTTGANPYLIAIVGITALVSALSSFSKETEELAKVSNDFTNSLNEQTEEVKKNFRAITQSKDGTLDRAKAIQTVNEKYKDYLPNLLTEKDSLDKIKIAQDQVTASLAKSLAFKAQENSLSSLKTNVDQEYTDFYAQIDRASKKMTDIQRGQFKAQIDQFKEQVKSSFSTLGYFPALGPSIQNIFKQVSGDNLGGLATTELELDIKDLIRSEVELDSKTNALKTTYESYLKALGLTGDSTSNVTENLKTIQNQIDEANRSISESEDRLKKMRAPGSTATISDIESEEQNYNNLKSKLETLTGLKKKEVDKQLKTEQEKLEALRDLAQKELEIRQNLEESMTSAIQEGSEKQRRIIEDSYTNQLLTIEKAKKDYLEKLNKSKGLTNTDSGYITTLPDALQNDFDQMAVNARQKRDNEIFKLDEELVKRQMAIWNDTTEAFITNSEKEKRAINEKYDNLIERQKSISNDQAAIDEINLARNKELSMVSEEAIIKLSPLYQKAFGDIEKYGTASLKRLKEQLSALTDSAKQVDVGGKTMIEVSMPTGKFDAQGNEIRKQVRMTIEEFTNFKKQLVETSDALDKKNPFEALKSSFKKLVDAFKSDLKGPEKEKLISDAFTKFNADAKLAISEIKQLADVIGGDLGNALNTISDLAEGGLNITSGIESGDPVKVLTGVAQVYSIITNAASEYRDAQMQWTSDLIDLQREYNVTLLEQLRIQKESSIFFTDYSKKIKIDAAAFAEAQQKYVDELVKTGKVSQYAVVNGVNTIKDIGAATTEVLNKLTVKTGVESTGWFGWGGKEDVFGSLLQNYKGLQNADGTLNVQLAETLLSNDALWTNANKGSKQALEGLVAYTKQMEASKDSIDSALESLAGSLGSNLFNALKDAWDNGKDSFTAYKDTVTKGLKDIAKEMLFNAIYAQDLMQLQTEMYASYGLGPDGKTKLDLGDKRIDFIVTDDIQRYYARTSGKTAQWDAGNKSIDEQFGKISENYNKTATSGIAASATQEVLSAMVGQAMAMRVDLKSMSTSLTGMNLSLDSIKGTLNESNNYLFLSLSVLRSIDTNTGETSKKLTQLSDRVDRTNQILSEGLL